MGEEKRRAIGFGAIHCFGSSKEKKRKVWKLSQAILVYGLLGKT